VQWLCYLRSAQALGFTLAEIEAGMPLLEQAATATAATAATAAPMLREALRRKLDDIDARIAGLAALREGLARELETPLACPVLSSITP